LFQSDTINTYARRVKTQKYPRIFMRTTRSWGFNYFNDQAAPPQQSGCDDVCEHDTNADEVDGNG